MTSTNFESFQNQGYVILRSEEILYKVKLLRQKFETDFRGRFSNKVEMNRNLLRLFANTIEVNRLFCEPQIFNWIKELGLVNPVFSGIANSGYTSYDETSRGFGSVWHQEWPAMATSLKSIVIWTNLVDSSPQSHSLMVVPGMHRHGIIDGPIHDDYGLLMNVTDEVTINQQILTIEAGEILIMSAFLPHATYVNRNAPNDWKLSLNQRVSDLDAEDWKKRDYIDARNVLIKNTIDWKAYLR